MERLTNSEYKKAGFHTYIGKQNPYDTGLTLGELSNCPQDNFSPKEILKEIFAKLAAYEDNGTPEQFAAWKKADEEGRIAPCNWGDKIYGITGRFGNRIIKEYTVSHSTLFSDEIKITSQCGESFIYGRSAFLLFEKARAALEAQEGE